MRRMPLIAILMFLLTDVVAGETLVIYGSRQYTLMEPLLKAYEKARGVEVSYFQEKSVSLLQRLRDEGSQSPADLLLTADIGMLEAAKEDDLLQPTQSPLLVGLIPARYRDPQGYWFGLSLRARLILYIPTRIEPGLINDYADLASPALKGKLCIRSFKHVYNQSLFAALISRWGEAKAQAWLEAVANNLARPPEGGDRDQIRAMVDGECDLALVNSYYYAMMLNSENPRDREVATQAAWIWPDSGVHVNISGGGVTRHAPHPQLGMDFLEFLVGFQRQRLYAELNQEYPVVTGVHVSHTLMRLGAFEASDQPMALIARQKESALALTERLEKKHKDRLEQQE
ncbi:MAG: hypothetical protein B6D70_13085 [gamma proteobacterium symbiont of Stewartia floridana]|nr:extracellular solute-binding protein [Candidatus Thiodiazotropha taylori]RLW52439.1 MAG: hypothetical protein B6D76_15680 [gamma proteobacterium symbiont of Stewartia floridana]MCG7926621.1 extracellular solute-binding protein [Candidatus Thiodiazotropha taylori]MCG7935556.1 extracellular solute-binding protein [Candidatus Thiodiazotropha taylori]MCG7969882.1 extracellular solute-binding protein [Candidatus Thiodiazotropha taylori]